MSKAAALLVTLSSLACLASCSGAAAVEAQPGVLLDVSNGQKPNDTGSSATKMEIVDLPALGGKALQVDFAEGDSIGVKGPKTTNWSQYATFQFDAYNPARDVATLSLNVFHSRTTNYKTRLVVPIRLDPGKNSIRLNVADFRNVNGSEPDLTEIKKWFIAADDRTSPKLFFGPISLDRNSTAPGQTTTHPSATQQPVTPATSVLLLDVAHGQKPNAIGTPQTKTEIVDQPDLDGKALKVEFAPGDSFGMTSPKTDNWTGYSTLQFETFNPTQQFASLTLSVFHNQTTDDKTRGASPIRVAPGKQSFRLPIADVKNVDGSTPELRQIRKWCISAEDGTSPKLFFGPILLSGSAAAPAVTSPGLAVPSMVVGRTQSYRITGKIGGQDVDLIVTPFDDNSAPASAPASSRSDSLTPAASPPPVVPVDSDPARFERLRAAKPPQMWKPVALDTPEADAILSGLEVFPSDSPWNTLVSDWPIHPDSKQIVATIGADKPLRYNPDMSYVLVPPHQPRISVKLTDYADESDPGPYPVPDNLPIEGWPAEYRRRTDADRYTLDSVQRDRDNLGGDRHAIVLDPVNRMLYEFYGMRKTDAGWQAAGAAIFDLKSNRLRPDGWTSTDAAGLPLFPAVVRYDELKRGVIDHALRVTVRRSRKAYVYPATHHAGHATDVALPRMGERLRLRRDFDMSGFSPEATTILTALQRYGMIVADNGIEWAVSVAPDPRIPSLHDEFRELRGGDFEVVEPPAGYRHPD
jgi:hypothetical protein